MPSGKFQLYLEIESKNTDDWNSIRSIVETLNGIDIQPKEELNFDEMAEDDANSNGDDDDTGSWGQFKKKYVLKFFLTNFQNQIPYAPHYNPRFLYFVYHFLLRFIL